MVFGFSKEERDERRADRAAQKIAQKKRRAGRRAGLVESAYESGKKEGKEQAKAGGGTGFAKLAGAAKFLNKNFEIGPRKGGQDFALFGSHDNNGPSRIGANADDFALGMPRRTGKGKKRDIYDKYGL